MTLRTPLDLILIGYRLGDTRKALRFCEALCPPGSTRRRVLVLNRPELLGELGRAPAGWETVAGSNSLGEFSAWQEGLDMLGRSPASTLFVNDTVTTHRLFSRARRQALLAAVSGARGAAIVGFPDSAAGTFVVHGKPLDRWISTYCFALTADALARLDYQLAVPSICDGCVPGGLDEAAFFDDMSPDLADRLRVLLFGGGWYASQELSPRNAELFRFKARCVVAEKYLSARCIELGISFVDPFERHPLVARMDRVETLFLRAVAKLGRELRRMRAASAP